MGGAKRRILVVLAVAGTGVCLAALGRFLVRIATNAIPWEHVRSTREHYLAVGASFSEGFAVGFFLCFFLLLIAYSLATAWERRSRPARVQAHLVTK